MASVSTNHKIHDVFRKFPPDHNFFWFSITEGKYVGVLGSRQNIVYTRNKDDILTSLYCYHHNHISNVVIFSESGTSGLPDATTPVFIGSEWVAEWNDIP